jgi:hypothetical protein
VEAATSIFTGARAVLISVCNCFVAHASFHSKCGAQARGLVQQHIESFDYFLKVELRNILEANKEVRSEVSIPDERQSHKLRA